MTQYTLSCIPRKGWLVALIAFSVFVTVGLIILDHTSARMLREEGMEETIAVMRTRLKFLESQYRGREQDVIGIQARVDSGCNTPTPVAGNDDPNTTYSPELSTLLKNITGSKASDALTFVDKLEPIKAPFSLRIMPHLMDHPDSLRPAYHLRSSRQFADYIIGVPHVKRDKENYLFQTIKFLLDKMTNEDEQFTMIAVMIGETNLTYVVETAHRIDKTFSGAIAAGLIEVISPSQYYYPNLDALPANLGDSLKRVKWRTKQNLDAIYLMAYAHSKCLYYLMIEDDVIAADDYMMKIRKFTSATSVTNPDWFFIQYSTTGGIGKLFRSTDLIHFTTYVQLFYNNMPIDWLTESYLADRSCGINKGSKECSEAKTKIRPTYKQNLFKHIGLFSSLKGKMQKVKYVDRIISGLSNDSIKLGWWKWAVKKRRIAKEGATPVTSSKISDFFPHKNPPVTHIKCDLSHHDQHSIEAAYYGDSFFWGLQPKKDDVIEFWFETPGKFDRYLVRSGSLKHAHDIISNAVFEILPSTHQANESFVQIDKFDEFGMVEAQVDSDKYGELHAMRIRFEANGKYWVAITEIEFVYLDMPHIHETGTTNATNKP